MTQYLLQPSAPGPAPVFQAFWVRKNYLKRSIKCHNAKLSYCGVIFCQPQQDNTPWDCTLTLLSYRVSQLSSSSPSKLWETGIGIWTVTDSTRTFSNCATYRIYEVPITVKQMLKNKTKTKKKGSYSWNDIRVTTLRLLLSAMRRMKKYTRLY